MWFGGVGVGFDLCGSGFWVMVVQWWHGVVVVVGY